MVNFLASTLYDLATSLCVRAWLPSYPCYTCYYSDPSIFQSFVSGIRADGGDDSPEDIMGGLSVTFCSLSWRSEACKVK